MDFRAAELWSHAPSIVEKLDVAIKQSSAAAKEDLLTVLGIDTGPQVTVEETKAGIEDFEYALQAAVLQRLEEPDADVKEVPRIIELAAECVCALYERASVPDVSASETDRCKSWWMMFVQITEETTKLVSLVQLEKLVEVFERSLVKLRKASLALAAQRLKEFDAKQEAEAKALKETAPDPNKKEAKLQKEAKDRETKRLDERKKLITQLGVSPNGHVFLTLTSLLKQLSSRLAGSFNSRLRTRISLLLERLLALDHKAIANNQKVRTQDFFTPDDLDDNQVLRYSLDGKDVPTPLAQATPADANDAAAKKAEELASSLGHDPAITFETYKSFWSLQEWLQVVEKLFDKKENWKQFHDTLTALLNQFSKYPASAAQREPAQSPESLPPRQVPRARAFRVQMDDPNFRIQFLTQVLICFQALEQDVSSRTRHGGLISTQTKEVQEELRGLRNQIEQCLAKTRQGCDEMVTHLLSREVHWVNWKGQGCREWEHDSLEMLTGKAPEVDTLPEQLMVHIQPATKPKLDGMVKEILKEVKDYKLPVLDTLRKDDEGQPEACAKVMRELCERALDRHEEDEDPAQGIEEEYKSKHNKAFMWQSRRLFGRHHLRVYAKKEVYGKTEFMDFVRFSRGRLPPEPPKVEAEVVDTEAAKPPEEAAKEAPSTAAPDSNSGGTAPETTSAPQEEAVIEGEKVAANIVDDGYGPPVAEVTEPPTKKAKINEEA